MAEDMKNIWIELSILVILLFLFLLGSGKFGFLSYFGFRVSLVSGFWLLSFSRELYC
jgi:hypothetical protein